MFFSTRLYWVIGVVLVPLLMPTPPLPCPQQSRGGQAQETARPRTKAPGKYRDQVPPLPGGDQAGGGEGLQPPTGQAVLPAEGRGPYGVRTARSRGSGQDHRWQVWWQRSRFAYLTPAPLHSGGYQGSTAETDSPEALAQWRAETRKKLDSLCRHGSSEVRREAILALSMLGDPGDLETIRAALGDPVLRVSDTAILAMGVLASGSQASAEAAHTLMHIARGTGTGMAALTDRSLAPYRQGIACLALATTRSPMGSGLLAALIRDRTLGDEVRMYAAWALGMVEQADVALDLIEVASQPAENIYLRGAAISALGHLGAREAMPIAHSHLRSGKPAMARSSALMLGLVATPGETGLLDLLQLVALRTSDVDLRCFASMAMGQIGGPTALENLARLLARGRSALTPWSAIASGLCCRTGSASPAGKPPGADASLVERMGRKLGQTMSANDRSALALAIGLSGMDEGRPALAKTLARGGSPTVAGYAALALGMIGDVDDMECIARRAAVDSSPLFLSHAAFGVALLDHRDSLSLLLEWLRRKRQPVISREIALGLGLLGRIEAIPVLLDMLEKQTANQALLASVARALGLLLRADPEPPFLSLAAHTNDIDEPSSACYVIDLLY